jgi:transcription elongation factor GreA
LANIFKKGRNKVKKQYRLTQDGVDELQKEQDSLIAMRGPIAERIRSARELGDLSENAEYQTARDEQDRTESRISELEHILQNLTVIKKPKENGVVRLGSTVNLKSPDGKTKQFQVVGTMEADPSNGKISDESPIGKVLMGKKVGEQAEIKTPSETIAYKISSIN